MTRDEPMYTVQTAADLLSEELGIRLARNDLFQWLVEHGWAHRTPTGYCPNAVALSLLEVQPAPAGRLIWDQLLITTTGLGMLRALLATNHLFDIRETA